MENMKQTTKYIEWTKPTVSKSVYKKQLKEIRDQLHRFEYDVWHEERKKHTQVSWYEGVLEEIKDIAFSEDKKHYPKKEHKINAIKSLFDQICTRVLYNQERYAHHHGFKGSGGYQLAEYIKGKIHQAIYIFPHNPDFKKTYQKPLITTNQSCNWEEITYEDVIEVWKNLRKLLSDWNQIRIDLKIQISHLRPLELFNYQIWIERRVSENIQILLYQKQTNPLEKWIMAKFVIKVLKTQLWYESESFVKEWQVLKDLILSENLKVAYQNWLNLEQLIASEFSNLLALLEAKIFQSNNLMKGVLESQYLISPKIQFWHNGKKLWFASCHISHYQLSNQSISYYQPLDPFTNDVPEQWVKLMETNDSEQIIDYLKEHNLIVQISYATN